MIFMGCVLVHIPAGTQEAALAGLLKKVKPGGYMVVYGNDNKGNIFGTHDHDVISVPPKYYLDCQKKRNQWTARQCPAMLGACGVTGITSKFFTYPFNDPKTYGGKMYKRSVDLMVHHGKLSRDLGDAIL